MSSAEFQREHEPYGLPYAVRSSVTERRAACFLKDDSIARSGQDFILSAAENTWIESPAPKAALRWSGILITLARQDKNIRACGKRHTSLQNGTGLKW
jgi:hypothetical protein